MPIKPQNLSLEATGKDIVNAIRSSATENYRSLVPLATNDNNSIREIGKIVMEYPAIKNEFLSALYNRIAKVLITSKVYYNPWRMFKKGFLEYGETVEEIFINIAKVQTFDPEKAEKEYMKRELPDVRSAFHTMNYQKFYKVTVSEAQLRQAFLSYTGISDLITRIIESMYTGASYDEFLVMKYLLARNILNGHLTPVSIPTVSDANAKKIVSVIKGVSNKLEFMSDKYNYAQVLTKSDKKEQYIIINTEFDATLDVEVLASAFNMNKVEFMGNRILIDSFGELDNARLAEIFADDTQSGYIELSSDEIELLNKVPAVIVDRNFFMVFDNLERFTEDYNGQGMYWNYWYHTWKTLSTSPYSNSIIFAEGTPSVETVEVSPNTASAGLGNSLQLTANVTVNNFAPTDVVWTINSSESNVAQNGKVVIGKDEAMETVTVTATSVYDPTKSDSCVITIV